MPQRHVVLVIDADGKLVDAEFDRLEKRADRLESRLKASTAGLSRSDLRAIQQMSNEQVKTMKEAERIAAAATTETRRATEAATRKEYGITSDLIKRQARETQQAVEAAAKKEAEAVSGAQKLIRAEYQISSDIIKRQSQRTAQEQSQSAAEFKRAQETDLARRKASYPAGYAPVMSVDEFTRAQEAEAAAKLSAVEMKKRAAEVRAIEEETTRQAAQQAKLKLYTAAELEKAKVTLARHSADEMIRAAKETGEVEKASFGETKDAVLAVVAAVTTFVVAIYTAGRAVFEMARSAAHLAAEIAKAQAATALSAETLSTLRFVAQGNGIEFNQVADAVARFESNLVRMDLQGKRAQRTLVALGIDAEKAARDPEKAFSQFLVAFSKLPPTADRAYIATQLFGKGGADLIKMFDELAPGIAAATARAEKFGVVMSQENVEAAQKLDNALADLSAAWEGLKLAIGIAALEASTEGVNRLTEAVRGLKDTTKASTSDISYALSRSVNVIDGLVQVLRIALDLIAITGLAIAALNFVIIAAVEDLYHLVVAISKLLTGDWQGFKEEMSQMVEVGNTLASVFSDIGKAGVWAFNDIGNAINRVLGLFGQAASKTFTLDGTEGRQLTEADIARLTMNRQTSRPSYGSAGGRKQESELERLQKEYRKLTQEIEALQKVLSREFELRFKVETLQRVKSDLESILKLRNEMRLKLDDPLPVFNARATEEVQARQREEVQQTVETYESLKRVFDGVREVLNEQREAEEQLTIARKALDMPVVGALTRAEMDYSKAVRESRQQIQQLAADVITTTKLRERAERGVAESTAQAYLAISADYAKRERELDESIARRRAFLQALRDPSQLRATVEGQIDLSQPKPPSELAQIADHAANIRANVARIALSTTGSSEGAPQTTAEAEARVAASYERWLAGLSRFKAALGMTDSPTPPGQATRPDAQAIIDTAGGLAPSDTDGVERLLVDKNALRGLLDNETVLRVARKEAVDARLKDEEAATLEIIANEARLGNQLIEYDLDLRRARSASVAAREREAREQTIAIQLLEDDLTRAQLGDEEILSRMRRNAREDRLTGALDLKQQIVTIEDEIAHAGENSADRQALAYLTARRDIIEADLAARDSIIRSQVMIADATVFHADQVQARVLEHLASQKSITQAVGDSIIGVYDSIVGLLDRGIDKLTGKVSLLNEVLKAIVRSLVSSVFQRFLSGMSGPGAAQSAQGGSGDGILGFLSRLFGGSRGGSALQFTGGFAGGAGGGSYLGFASQFLNAGINPSGAAAPESFFDSQQRQTLAASIIQQVGLAPGDAARMGAGSLSASGIGGALAPLLPLLGLQGGLALGGGRGLSGILGGGAGLLLGGAGLAALAPGLFGVVPGAMTVAGSGSAAFMAGLHSLLTNPFTIGIAAAALISAYFINRSAQRRKNETDRAALNSDTYSQIIEVLNATRRGDLTLTEAMSRWNEIKTNYFNRIANYDSKTKRIAADVWNKEFEPTYLPLIRQAAKEASDAKDRESRFIPTFSSGGDVREVASRMQPFAGRVPGRYTGRDPYLIRVDGDEDVLVLNPTQRARLNLSPDRLAAAGVPGYAQGGAPNGTQGTSGGSFTLGGLSVEVHISQGTQAQTQVVKAVLRSKDGKEITVDNVRAHVYEEREDGLAGDVYQVLTRK